MNIREELKSAGVYPTGPVSAWPEERNKALHARSGHATKVKATPAQMAKSLITTGSSMLRSGRVSQEIRDERYDTCKACPAFVEGSKRCSECGCFMEAKTWVGGDPDTLCPLKKWSR